MFCFTRGVVTIATALTAALCCTPSMADLIGATSSPKRAEVTIEDGKSVQIRWVISTDPAHESGAFSPQGTLRDTATDTVLKTVNNPFDLNKGAGPIFFEESLTLTSEEAKKWYDMGHRKLEFERVFTTGSDLPSTSEAAVDITLTSKEEVATKQLEQESLVAHSLQLTFKPLRFRQQVAQGLPLQAQLFVRFSGRGTLAGRWQLALVEPQGALTYKTLATVNKQISESSDFLLSPKLPTQTLGRHLLRFCIDSPSATAMAMTGAETACPNPQLSSTLQYDVVENLVKDGDEASPDEPANLTTNTQLRWPRVADTRVYELQIHQSTGSEKLASSDFVGRLLLSPDTNSTQLSADLINHLNPGATYTWQVNALDQHGDLILQTAPKEFIFVP